MIDDVRTILRNHGRLNVDVADLRPDADLYEAGMTSHASVAVMLELENRFDTEFPDQLLTRLSFSTIDNILQAVRTALDAHPASET